jgi:hypothetical protein
VLLPRSGERRIRHCLGSCYHGVGHVLPLAKGRGDGSDGETRRDETRRDETRRDETRRALEGICQCQQMRSPPASALPPGTTTEGVREGCGFIGNRKGGHLRKYGSMAHLALTCTEYFEESPSKPCLQPCAPSPRPAGSRPALHFGDIPSQSTLPATVLTLTCRPGHCLSRFRTPCSTETAAMQAILGPAPLPLPVLLVAGRAACWPNARSSASPAGPCLGRCRPSARKQAVGGSSVSRWPAGSHRYPGHLDDFTKRGCLTCPASLPQSTAWTRDA